MARILYIEDDKSIRNCMVLLMTKAGHSVLPRIDADKVDALADIWKPDVVITDHDLGPKKEKGLQAALRLKADGFYVVMLSGNHDAFRAATDADIPFFTKPYNIKTLLAEIGI